MNPSFLNATIIDDEADGRNIIHFLLQQFFPQITVSGQAGNVAEGISLVRSARPDLLFLDIEMPDGNAFDLLAACANSLPRVVLVTAHDHYALKAIKASVLDYLLKPVDETEFVQAVHKALKMDVAERNQHAASLSELYRHLMIRKVRIPTVNGFSLVNVDEIVHCEASGNYTFFFFTNGRKIVVSRKLGDYETELKRYGFVRVHSKHLINVSHIIEYNKGKIGGGYLVLAGRITIEVSARRKVELLRLLR